MPTRQDVVNRALSFNGYLDGAGYDGANQFSSDLGHPNEAWCADFVTDVYKRAGVALPTGMQAGCPTGFAYVPAAVEWARHQGAVVGSWAAQPGDLVAFDWSPADGMADHVEMAEAVSGGMLLTIGGNSGPSNIDGFAGRGGVHRHRWPTSPPGGNPLVLAVINADAMVSFGVAPRPPPPPLGTPAPLTRWLMLKTPYLQGPDVVEVQQALVQQAPVEHGQSLACDGVYGPQTNAAVISFQRNHGLEVDGVVGPQTARALGLTAKA